jgi:hypothetical protein
VVEKYVILSIESMPDVRVASFFVQACRTVNRTISIETILFITTTKIRVLYDLKGLKKQITINMKSFNHGLTLG